MEEIDDLLADENFCRSLLDGTANVPAASVLTDDCKIEQVEGLWQADTDYKSDPVNLWSQTDCDEPLLIDGDILGAFDRVLMQSSARQSSESGRSSLTESGSASSVASGINTLHQSADQSNAYSFIMEETNLPDSSKMSSLASSSNSNSDPLEDQLEVNYDEELGLDFDMDDYDDYDDDIEQPNNRKQAGNKNGAQSHPVTKKPPLFQPLRSTGELKLTELEKQTLAQEGYTIQNRLPLSKHDERILKQVRRKIRNKISAQESRRKKRAHVDDLESRLKHFARENRDLRAQLKAKEDAFQKIASRFSSLRAFVSRHIRFDVPSTEQAVNPTDQASVGRSKQPVYGLHPKPAFMALFLCFAVLVGCRPGALRTSGYFFPSVVNSPADLHRFTSNITDTSCNIALIAYPCDADGTHQGSDEFGLEEYYFDGRSFFDRNAPSIRSLRTLKRFSDQSNAFREAADNADASSLRSAFDSLLNAFRYSTARTLFRRTVTATSAKLAAKLNSDNSFSQETDSNNSTKEASAASSADAPNGKLLDQRVAPGRTLLFKWTMNDTALSDWWNKVMRSFVGEPFCLSYMY